MTDGVAWGAADETDTLSQACVCVNGGAGWACGGRGSPTQMKGSRDMCFVGTNFWGSTPAVRAPWATTTSRSDCRLSVLHRTHRVCVCSHTHRTTGYKTSSSLAECADTACTDNSLPHSLCHCQYSSPAAADTALKCEVPPNSGCCVPRTAQHAAAQQTQAAAVTRCALRSAARLTAQLSCSAY